MQVVLTGEFRERWAMSVQGPFYLRDMSESERQLHCMLVKITIQKVYVFAHKIVCLNISCVLHPSDFSQAAATCMSEVD